MTGQGAESSPGEVPVVVAVDAAAGVGTLAINRPDKKNALNAAVVTALAAGLRSLVADDRVRVIVIRGEGTAFCAGADLDSIRTLATASHGDNLADSRRLRDLLLDIYRSPKPTIAAVEGPALAGGCGLASTCDFVIASSEATFGYPEVKIGFVAAIVMVFLTRQVGERAARDLLLTGRTLTARDALAIGLITSVVPPDALDAEVALLAKALGRNSSEAMRRTKLLLERSWRGDMFELLDAAAFANADARATPDCKEGVAAFLEKRRPVWAPPGKTQ